MLTTKITEEFQDQIKAVELEKEQAAVDANLALEKKDVYLKELELNYNELEKKLAQSLNEKQKTEKLYNQSL